MRVVVASRCAAGEPGRRNQPARKPATAPPRMPMRSRGFMTRAVDPARGGDKRARNPLSLSGRRALSQPVDFAFPVMLNEYLPVLLQVVAAAGLAAAMLIASVMLGRTGTRNATKDSAYECGMLPIGEAQPRFSVKFYM